MRRLWGDAVLYTLSNLLVRGLGLLLLPVYVRLLSQEDYGRLDLLTVVGSVVAVVIALEVTQGMMRFVSEAGIPQKDRDECIATTFWITVALFGTFLAVVGLTAGPLAQLLLGHDEHALTVLTAAGWYAMTAVVYFWTVAFRALLRARAAALISLASGLLVGAGGVGAAQVIPGLQGLLLGNLLGQTLVAIAVTWAGRSFLHRPSRARAHTLLKFSLPLVISSLAVAGGLYADRFLVRGLLGLEALGSYGVAARLASAVGLLLVGLQNALTPLVYASLTSSDLGAQLGRIFRWYAAAAAVATAAMALVDDAVVRVIAGSEYEEGATVLVTLALATLIRGSYIFFPGLFVAKRTAKVATINLASVAVGISLGFVLVPKMGLTGAAMAAVISALVSVVPVYVLGQRHLDVEVLPRRRVAQRT